jgi:hypothetical protein
MSDTRPIRDTAVRNQSPTEDDENLDAPGEHSADTADGA